MIDPGPALQQAYISLLAGLAVPVWAIQAPDDQQGNYIIFQRGETAPKGQKNAQNDQVEVSLQCITRLGTGTFSDVPCDELAQAVLNTVFPSYGVCALTVPGFQLWQSIWLGTRPLPNVHTGTDRLIRRQLRIRHQLHPN